MPQRAQLAESRPLQVTEADGNRLRVRLITPGWGSSGYYSQEVVESAATAKVWPAGTHMYLDHPSNSEDRDRPERSVKHLAAVLESDGEWTGEGVDADVRVFSDYADFIRERADVLGVSIRASGQMEMGEAEGRKGRIITELVEAQSVDFVTRAGRGGRILQLLESALPSEVTARAVGRDADLTEATANDMRDQLQQAVRAAYATTDEAWAYVEDFDPAGVAWYSLEAPTGGGLYAHDFTADSAVTLTGNPRPVRRVTSYVPVTPAADTTTEEALEAPMPQIEEARLRQLETDAGRVQALESERDTERQRATVAEAELARVRARDSARPIVTSVVAEARRLPASWQNDVVNTVLSSVPVTESGAVDETKLREAAEAARKSAETRLAEALAANGAGTPRDLAGDDTPTDVTESDAKTAVARAFGRPVKEA